MGQGQPKMLHTKFRRNWPTGSWKEDFERIYTMYGHGGHLRHVASILLINFHFNIHLSLKLTYKMVNTGSAVDLDLFYGNVKFYNLGFTIGNSENSVFFTNYCIL